MINLLIIMLLLSLFTLSTTAQTNTSLPPSGLMCDLVEHTTKQSLKGYHVKVDKINLSDTTIQSVLITSEHPAFTWQVNDIGNNVIQVAYQLLVSDNALFDTKGDTWDSGKIISSQSCGNVYTGPSLKPGKVYYWKVRVWN
ncbi:MAG: hypothetical protein EOO85_30830, partial [Pedobacter sp.]